MSSPNTLSIRIEAPHHRTHFCWLLLHKNLFLRIGLPSVVLYRKSCVCRASCATVMPNFILHCSRFIARDELLATEAPLKKLAMSDIQPIFWLSRRAFVFISRRAFCSTMKRESEKKALFEYLGYSEKRFIWRKYLDPKTPLTNNPPRAD